MVERENMAEMFVSLNERITNLEKLTQEMVLTINAMFELQEELVHIVKGGRRGLQ